MMEITAQVVFVSISSYWGLSGLSKGRSLKFERLAERAVLQSPRVLALHLKVELR
ncbi:MAG TPA: hypothetical protein VNE42_07265 [Acidimicrobiales bacterium]|nr:hypothetical protein [Acidimicrobiales bacterium]